MRTEESLSPNEESIKAAWLAGIQSIRQIAKDHGVSDAWVRKLAKRHEWPPRGDTANRSAHRGANSTALVVLRPPADARRSPRDSSDDDGEGASDAIRKAARSDPAELVDDTRDILARLRDELDAVTSYVGELEDLIIDDTADDKDSRRRNAMLKAVSLPTRILAAKNLALALKTLTDAAPGKKEEANNRASEVASGQDDLWGDDLAVPASARFQ
jgi:hypothetical protein